MGKGSYSPENEDEEDEPTKPGPKPERLKSDETFEQMSKRILDAGKPLPEECEDEEDEWSE